MEKSRNSFSGSLGFVLAAASSAIGLGNIWRFPYLAARDGGGLFLVIYIVLTLTFGFTLLITEVALGRRSGQGPLTAYGFFNKKWSFLGIFSFIVPFIIYPYYCVIGGWVLKYLVTYLTADAQAACQDGYFSAFISSHWPPIIYMTLFAAASFYVVYLGVEKGIERYSRILMPVLFILIIGMSLYSLTLSATVGGVTRTGLEGAELFFIPDIEGLTVRKFLMTVVDAMGQLFYSLSVAMGIMIAYGSYMKKDVNLGKTVDQIEICDTLIAVLAGLMIIPAVYVFMGTEGMSAGPGLMFVALPKVFESMGSVGLVFGAVFFLMVLFAAVTSSISILEACVVSGMDRYKWSRRKSVTIMGVLGFILSIAVCLGYNEWYFELPLPNGAVAQLLDLFDYTSNNILMPIVATGTCILFGWVAKPRLLIGEIRLNGYRFRRKMLYIIMLRYVAPVCLIILLLGAFGLY